jgi:glycosyltransferase involved in cell wall biosynthesis
VNKKKIYYLLSDAEYLRPIAGDSITEIAIMTALSKNYDVYYNNQLFRSELKNYGLKPRKVTPPAMNYDLHIVRNNPKIFNQISGRKVYFATPYDSLSFSSADYISTFTESWTQKLIDGYDFPYNAYPSGYKTDKAITIRQVIPDEFFKNNRKKYYKTQRARKKFGGSFVIGHFGRVTNSCYPHSFLFVLKRLKKVYPNIRAVFCGNSDSIRNFGKRHNIPIHNFSYSNMPYAISACDLILYNYRDGQGHIAGSMKVLEAMARGVPILCPRYDARIEELGEDYELFYPYEDICATNAAPTQDRFSDLIERKMFRIIKRCIDEPEYLEQIGRRLRMRAEYFSVDNSAIRLKKTIDGVIEGRI